MSDDERVPSGPANTPVGPGDSRRKSTAIVAAVAGVVVLVILAVGIPFSVAAASALLHQGPPPEVARVQAESPSPEVTAQDPEQVAVPNVVGMTRADARAALQELGFTVVDGTPTLDESDLVVAQDPTAPGDAATGSVVSLRFAPPSPSPTPTPTTAPAPAPPPADIVQYSVWGNGSTASSVTYSIPNGAFSQSQVGDASIPWSVTLPISGSFNAFVLLAQAGDGNSISCAITINGQIVDQQTSTGQYTIVTCSHSSY